ncbi:protein kinase [Myxococcota bacterium]|nr:protein kinase [Myxococcota bacterium]MBU1410250.1 protein kinase [Myxococcota bacterium]MBU1509884.1 protein kinase [Myxococcota bacterium]
MQDYVGKYQLLERIASGGMADVYRALATGPGGFRKFVAIKRIREHMSGDPEFIDMFVREATLAARLDHPNVVQVFEFNRDRSQYYLVMEFVQGLDLKTALERFPGPWNPELAFYVASKVLAGLQYAHELADDQGRSLSVIHRDISPHNILLSANGEVKLADFGIAKMRDAVSHTHVNMVRGKLPYLSPEQARGETIDVRSDLFSLGLVLWEALTGVRRYGAARGADPMAEVMAGRYLPPSRLEPALEGSVDRLLQGLLDPVPGNRFTDAAQARARIEELFPRDASSTLARLIRAHQTVLPPPEDSTILLARDERSDTWELGDREADRPTTLLDRAITREEPAPAAEPTDTVPVRARPAVVVVELPSPRRRRRRAPGRVLAFLMLGLTGLGAGYFLARPVRELAAGPVPAWQRFEADAAEDRGRTRIRLVGGQFDGTQTPAPEAAFTRPSDPPVAMSPPGTPAPRTRVIPAASTVRPAPAGQVTTARPGSTQSETPAAAPKDTGAPKPAVAPTPVEPTPVADPSTGLKSAADWE